MSSAFRNYLLRSLSPEDLRLIEPHLVKVEVGRGALYRSGDLIEHTSFIDDGLVSFIARMQDGATVEVTSIACEGAIGLIPSLQPSRSVFDIVVQVPVVLWQIEKHKVAEAVRESAGCREMVDRLSTTALAQLGRMVVCNALHPLEARLARWLSLARDRLDSDTLPLTQAFLAEILGVKRPTVTQVARKLHDRGLIQYRWGTVQIVDRDGLREASCECYAVLHDVFRRLRTRPSGNSPEPSAQLNF
jgi:CRP-like cAMP-binding protein